MLRIEEGTHPNGNGIHGKRRKYLDENTQLAWVVQKYMSNIRSREEWKLRKQHNPMALGRKLDAAAAGASGPRCEPLSELIGIELLELV